MTGTVYAIVSRHKETGRVDARFWFSRDARDRFLHQWRSAADAHDYELTPTSDIIRGLGPLTNAAWRQEVAR